MLLLIAPALAPNPAWEGVLLAVSVLLAAGGGIAGVRAHGRHVVWLPLFGGALCWAMSLAGWLEPIPEGLSTPGGSLLLASGMLWNARIRHRAVCASCGCPTHGPRPLPGEGSA